VISRGRGDLGIDPRKCPTPSVVIIVDTIQLYPEEAYRRGLRLVTTSTRMRPADVLNPRIKTCNYLSNIMGRLEVNLAGADEGLMLTTQGHVAECTADNVFVVRNGRVTNELEWLDANREEDAIIAQANAKLNDDGTFQTKTFSATGYDGVPSGDYKAYLAVSPMLRETVPEQYRNVQETPWLVQVKRQDNNVELVVQ